VWFIFSQQSFKVVDYITANASILDLALKFLHLLLQHPLLLVESLVVLRQVVKKCSVGYLCPIGEQASLLRVKVVEVLQYLEHCV